MALTAYIITAFLEVGVRTKYERTSLRAAQKYLESNRDLMSDPYTAALASYGLTLLHSQHADLVLKRLKEMAVERGTHSLGPQECSTAVIAKSLVDKGKHFPMSARIPLTNLKLHPQKDNVVCHCI